MFDVVINTLCIQVHASIVMQLPKTKRREKLSREWLRAISPIRFDNQRLRYVFKLLPVKNISYRQ